MLELIFFSFFVLKCTIYVFYFFLFKCDSLNNTTNNKQPIIIMKKKKQKEIDENYPLRSSTSASVVVCAVFVYAFSKVYLLFELKNNHSAFDLSPHFQSHTRFLLFLFFLFCFVRSCVTCSYTTIL